MIDYKILDKAVSDVEYPVFKTKLGRVLTWGVINLRNGGMVMGDPSVCETTGYDENRERIVAKAKAFEKLRPLVENAEADRIMNDSDKMPDEDAKAYVNPDDKAGIFGNLPPDGMLFVGNMDDFLTEMFGDKK